jgi:integrase
MIIEEVSRHLERFGTANDLGLLITTERGTPVSRSLFGTRWRAAAARAGAPGLRFHDLRHWHTSLCIRAGMSVLAVADRLGHSSATITLDVYGHVFGEDRERGRGVIEAAFTQVPGYSRELG